MQMDWVGFTDDQLRQLKGQTQDIDDSVRGQHGRQPHRMQMGKPRQHQVGAGQRSKMMLAQRQRQIETNEALSDNQRLSVPKKVRARPVGPTQNNKSTPPQERRNKAKHDESSESVDKQGDITRDETAEIADKNQKVEKKKAVLHEIDEKEGISRELSNIEKIQKQQKEMEEENKKKKAMLVKAVADRKKRTDAEMRKLKEIQRELTKIDGLISHDVSILRDKIEDASREYMDAQRRYERAEAEFVASKISLHQKTEVKDSLTEHLYSIIQENEKRKAEKLEELTNKLDVENLEEYYNVLETHDAAIQSNDVQSETKTVATTSTATDSTQVEPGESVTENADKEKTSTTKTPKDSEQSSEEEKKPDEKGEEKLETSADEKSDKKTDKEEKDVGADSTVTNNV
ncbi:RAB6-interacting golgin-like [Glandiceps talaboti]